MFGTQDLVMFVIAGLLLNMTPGADTLYIVSRSAAQGVHAGIVAALGIGAGCLVHIVAAAVGISAILAASATAFFIVKLVGAAYLLYLGISMMFSRKRSDVEQPILAQASMKKIFQQGFFTNALNPKVALFFLAFLPQFIAPDAEQKWLGMLFLGWLFNVTGTIGNVLVAWSAAQVSGRMKASPSVGLWLNRCCGGLFIYFGVKLVQSEN